MLIFLYGPDTYRSKRKLEEIIKEHRRIHKNGLCLRIFDEENINFSDFKNELETISMFGDKKLLALKDVFADKKFSQSVLDYKDSLLKNKEDVVVFWERDVDKRTAIFNFLKKSAKCQEFNMLAGSSLSNWAKKELTDLGAKIQPNALRELIIASASDLWRLRNEIEKLANFRRKGIISLGDVNDLVQSETETNVFETIEAIAGKNKKSALSHLHEHLEKGEQPLYLLTMINYQFRNLLLVKDLVERKTPHYLLAKKSGLHPFVVKKSWEACQRFSLPELKKIYRKIFQIDLDIKTGKVGPETALDLFISGI